MPTISPFWLMARAPVAESGDAFREEVLRASGIRPDRILSSVAALVEA